ncbi:MAG: hypothetical protein AB7N73_06035 [Gemmatimonadales bacterium]
MTRAALALLAIATAAACGDGAPAGAHTAIDSAGVRVVTSTAPSWGPDAGWRVDTVPELEVGSGARAGDPLLIGVEAVRRLADGQHLVATTDDQVLRWIDRDGAVVRTAGGAGEGPGEYRGLSVLGFIGDSLLTWDGRLGRVTVVAPDGAPARQFRLGNPDSANATRYGFAPSAVLDGDRLLLAGVRGAATNERSGLRRDTIPLATASTTGEVGPVFARVPGTESVVASTADFVAVTERPFGATTAVAAADGAAYVSVGDVDEVRRYDPATGLTAIYRLDRPRRLISPAEIERQGRRRGAQAGQLPDRVDVAITSALLSAGIPTAYPAHDRLLVDATGAIWLREDIGAERALEEARSWTILAPTGEWLGRVVTPVRFEVHQVTRDRVVGVQRTADDVEVVRVLRLRR